MEINTITYEYILEILLEKEDIIYFWGFKNPKPIYNGLVFSADLLGEKSFVKVLFDENSGIYNISILSETMKLLKEFNSVVEGGIVNIIDKLLRKENPINEKFRGICDNYREYE